jgi:Ca2+-transporting ATPase
MQRPRRPRAEPVLSRRLMLWSALQGAFALGLVMGFHAVFRRMGLPDADTRAMTFLSIVATLVVLIFVNRSFSASLLDAIRRPNPILWSGLAGLAVLLAAVLYVPFLTQLFGFGTLHGNDLLMSAGATGVALLFGLEAAKRWLSPLARLFRT